jgi:hypothetical protein
VKKIPADLQGKVVDGLVNLILNSQNAVKLPSNAAKALLHYWESDQLTSEGSLTLLVQASSQLEPQKTPEFFDGLGLNQIATALRPAVTA